MYKIGEITKEGTTTSYFDPVVGDSTSTEYKMVVKFPYKAEYSNISLAFIALDKVKRKGSFIIVKINK